MLHYLSVNNELIGVVGRIYVAFNSVSIGSGNDLIVAWNYQTIAWTDADLLSIKHLTNFSEILIEIQSFS